jgi:hypothetical protein
MFNVQCSIFFPNFVQKLCVLVLFSDQNLLINIKIIYTFNTKLKQWTK